MAYASPGEGAYLSRLISNRRSSDVQPSSLGIEETNPDVLYDEGLKAFERSDNTLSIVMYGSLSRIFGTNA